MFQRLKKIFFLFFLAPVLFAAEGHLSQNQTSTFIDLYESFHLNSDIFDETTAIRQFGNPYIFNDSNILLISGDYKIKDSQKIICLDEKCSKWCSYGWKKIKLYIPDGLSNFKLNLHNSSNADIVAILTFIKDEDNSPSLNMFEYEKVDEAGGYLNLYEDLFKANRPIFLLLKGDGNSNDITIDTNGLNIEKGWLYINFAMVDGENLPDKANIAVISEYRFENRDSQNRLQNWLKVTHFNQNGDPVRNPFLKEEKIITCDALNTENDEEDGYMDED